MHYSQQQSPTTSALHLPYDLFFSQVKAKITMTIRSSKAIPPPIATIAILPVAVTVATMSVLAVVVVAAPMLPVVVVEAPILLVVVVPKKDTCPKENSEFHF